MNLGDFHLYTHHKPSDNAIGAGYPIKEGWHIIDDPKGREVATVTPELAEDLCRMLYTWSLNRHLSQILS